MITTRHIIVLSGGDLAGVTPGDYPPADYVIAADSGLLLAEPLGLLVDLVVGDLDSVPPELLAIAESQGTKVQRFPQMKDLTDFELAMQAALHNDATHITVIGALGGRTDHTLGNLAVLTSPAFTHVKVVAISGSERVTVIREETEVRGMPGELISLIAFGGDAHGIKATGLLYELNIETLRVFESRGVSNEFSQDTAVISVQEGVVLAVQPGMAGTLLFNGLMEPVPT